jgi:hypothetical protein
VATGAGLGAKMLLGFSLRPALLADLLGGDSLLMDPLAAVGTAGAFGVTYLGTAALLGVGIPLRRRSSEAP